MGFTHGKDAGFKIDDAAGTLRTLTQYTDNVAGLPGARELSPVTGMGDQGVKSIPGLQNVSFTASGSFDSTVTTGPYAVLNSLRTATATSSFEYGPEGTGSGKVKVFGECWLKEFTCDASVGDKVPWSASFQVDGTVSTGTFA